ncbi:hypothetical protein [Sphingobium sp. MI1205]|uniref:hypothetical protein n=1 Tax=Sphingobium sp. MI1205 TaxID=407020 RepID=UPI0007705F81|nr:hypothetical protein [Sphingobium sp. MI1205]AMK19855.1 cytochrome P450 [Sphingobium sp. MI1205]
MLPNGKAHLLPEFAIKVPMYIIADQLGVDRADYDRFKLWSDVTVERNNRLLDAIHTLDQLHVAF